MDGVPERGSRWLQRQVGFVVSPRDKMGGIRAQGEKSLPGTVVRTASSAAQCVDLLLGRRKESLPARSAAIFFKEVRKSGQGRRRCGEEARAVVLEGSQRRQGEHSSLETVVGV